ncbi:MAG: zinc ABC transporter substrate-binding protein [Chloroflexi bacterium]|nr:zinc ABC transporter substrate-binding protein [Chloroflexota bacterium]
MVASHPVYQYLARRYGVNLRSVVWEPKTVPTERQWAELQQILESHPAKWMMWEGVPNAESIARLVAMGVGSIVFDPCGRRPEDGDFMSAMRDNVSALKRVFAR